MNQPSSPCDCHPDLAEDRLQLLAQFFAETRAAIVELHEPLKGDDTWSLGCRGFARWRNLLTVKANSGEWPWLRIINPGKKFIFAIGAVPVRFYRGQLHKAPARTLAHTFEELAQLSLAFPADEADLRNLKWRFAIATDYLGLPSSVIFAGLSSEDGKVAHHWEIPFDVVASIDLPDVRHNDIVELPAPQIAAFSLKKQGSSANDE